MGYNNYLLDLSIYLSVYCHSQYLWRYSATANYHQGVTPGFPPMDGVGLTPPAEEGLDHPTPNSIAR